MTVLQWIRLLQKYNCWFFIHWVFWIILPTKKCCHFWIHIVAHMANQTLSVYYLRLLLVNAKLYIKIWSEQLSLCWCTHVYFVKICILYLMGLNNHSHWRASKPIITTTINTITTITTTDWLLSYLMTLILEKVISMHHTIPVFYLERLRKATEKR